VSSDRSSENLAGLLTLDDYAAAAKTRLPSAVWDYLTGGAGDERTIAANRQAFRDVRLLPRILTGAGLADPGVRLFGHSFAAPIGVAPCAYHTLLHPDGEVATARAAGAAGLPFVLSTYSGRSFKDVRVAAAEENAVLWQQVYCFRERSITERLIREAEEAGVEALVLTVDTPHLGRRYRDLRNGFRLPPGIVAANLPAEDTVSPADHARAANDVALDWSVVDWLRGISSLPLLLKGVLTARDAVHAVAAGVDGVIVSNHGGRQLDGVPATLEALPAIAAAVAGRVPVLVDGGIRSGSDVLTALALGADLVLVGRPVLHGLAVGGSAGVRQVLSLLTEELRDAMTLSGAADVADVGTDLVDTSQLRTVGGPSSASEPPSPVAAPSALSAP
jgi:(S)-3,5-dihydroxyphenylglycine transaminase